MTHYTTTTPLSAIDGKPELLTPCNHVPCVSRSKGFKEAFAMTKTQRQATGAYTSVRGDVCMAESRYGGGIKCSNFFKDSGSIKSSINNIWADIITQSEQSKSLPAVVSSEKTCYNEPAASDGLDEVSGA